MTQMTLPAKLKVIPQKRNPSNPSKSPHQVIRSLLVRFHSGPTARDHDRKETDYRARILENDLVGAFSKKYEIVGRPFDSAAPRARNFNCSSSMRRPRSSRGVLSLSPVTIGNWKSSPRGRFKEYRLRLRFYVLHCRQAWQQKDPSL
jgi:hypothetical protein